MTAEMVIELLMGLIGPENAEEENEALGKAAKILQLTADNKHLHGRWIAEDEYYVDDTYICSACGYEFIITAGDLESNELNYCPRCGAKMDGGKS